MASIDVYSRAGESSGTVELDDALFGREVHVGAMHQVVVAQLAAARSDTSKVRGRSDMRGGGSKPWRQKGTGRARQGSTRAPQWTGGAVAHGPTGEQNHTKRVNKKLKRLALVSALSDRAASGDIRVVEDLEFDTPRTKDAVALLQALDLEARHALVVLAAPNYNAARSFRNLRTVRTITVDQLNTYDVLRAEVVVFARAALDLVRGPAAKTAPREEAQA